MASCGPYRELLAVIGTETWQMGSALFISRSVDSISLAIILTLHV